MGTLATGIGWASAPTYDGGGWTILMIGIGSFCATPVLPIIGAVDDYFYNKKVDAGKAAYRLPFHVRWDNWSLGPPPDKDPRWMTKMFLDKRFGKEVAVRQYYHPL